MDCGRSCDLIWRCESSEKPVMCNKTITTSDVGKTIAIMEEVLDADGSRSIVAGMIALW